MSMGNGYIARVFVFAFINIAVVLLYVLCLVYILIRTCLVECL